MDGKDGQTLFCCDMLPGWAKALRMALRAVDAVCTFIHVARFDESLVINIPDANDARGYFASFLPCFV